MVCIMFMFYCLLRIHLRRHQFNGTQNVFSPAEYHSSPTQSKKNHHFVDAFNVTLYLSILQMVFTSIDDDVS